MYIILKNNVCNGVNSLPLDQSSLDENEQQIEIRDESNPLAILGKTYREGQFVETEKTAAEKQAEMNLTETIYLKDTDWKVIRHRDQLALGIPTSLTDGEYKALLEARQQARNAVVNPN